MVSRWRAEARRVIGEVQRANPEAKGLDLRKLVHARCTTLMLGHASWPQKMLLSELAKVAPATVSPTCTACGGKAWQSLGEGRGSVSCPACNGRGTGLPIRTCSRHSDCRESPELVGVACALERLHNAAPKGRPCPSTSRR